MKFAVVAVLGVIIGTAVFLFRTPSEIVVRPEETRDENGERENILLPVLPEHTATSATTSETTTQNSGDIPPQRPLPNPPVVVKGIYLTNWSAGSRTKMASIFELIERNKLNGVVIDIKDYSGYLAYRTSVPLARSSGAEKELRISRPNTLIRDLHAKNVYVIGRISAFQDSILAEAHPEWALKNASSGKLWRDNKGLAWLDPAARPVWEYLAALAKDAHARGFDEANFDYIRFPSDGALEAIEYPFWDEAIPRHEVLAEFFRYLRSELPDMLISADLFGLATIERNDLGIGQVIEDAYASFDFVYPMVYPSHYANGFLGYKNPAAYPYEVVSYSLAHASERLADYALSLASGTSSVYFSSKIRPWLQAFDLGAPYTHEMIEEETRAVFDVLDHASSVSPFAGWLFWDPSNNYNNL